MNHTEFYREYRRREWLAIDIAMKRNHMIKKAGCAVTFYPDYAVVSAVDRNNKLIENIAIDGVELDRESPEYTALMVGVYELEQMTTDEILSEAVRRGFTIYTKNGVRQIGGASEPNEWFSGARGILWKRSQR